jgi:hypothetical protein
VSGAVRNPSAGSWPNLLVETRGNTDTEAPALEIGSTRSTNFDNITTTKPLRIPAVNAVPSGAPPGPAVHAGQAPLIYNRTDNSLYVYDFDSTAWVKVALGPP